MSAFKFTMLFSAPSAVSNPNNPIHRVGGWSESWYTPLTSIPSILNLATLPSLFPGGGGLVPLRASLLGKGASIVGYRIQQVDPSAQAQSGYFNYIGDPLNNQGQPQQALLYSVPGTGVANVRRMMLRGVPASEVTEGEYQPVGAWAAILGAYYNALGAWFFRGRDLSQPKVKILTISATGQVITENPHTSQPGDMVRILRSVTNDGDQLGGRFQVSTIGPGSNALTLLNWLGEATTGGYLRKDGVVYPAVSSVGIVTGRMVTRRVGRPFTQYRGRRSKRFPVK